MGNCYSSGSIRSTFFYDKDRNDKSKKSNKSNKITTVSRFRTVSEFGRARGVKKDPRSTRRVF